MNWTDKKVLVTGGTGSFGKKFVEIMLNEYHPARLIIFSRDELKQHEMPRQRLRSPQPEVFYRRRARPAAPAPGDARRRYRCPRRRAQTSTGLRI